MNRVIGINEPRIVNGKDMKCGDFGIIINAIMPHNIPTGSYVIKTYSHLINLKNGWASKMLNHYDIALKDKVTLMRAK